MKIEVSGNGYPVWIRITDGELGFNLTHHELLRFEHEIAEAKRQVLGHLRRDRWHEVDPKLIGG